MPVGDITLGTLHAVSGIQLGVAQAGVRYQGRDDLVIISIGESSTVSLVTTQNQFCAAPVLVAREHMNECHAQTLAPRYLLINTGNANAGTGKAGLQTTHQSCQALAQLASCQDNQVLPFSTGVIGEQIPAGKIPAALPIALDNLSADNWRKAAAGIMTTDTVPKAISEQIYIDDVCYTITGISKGSGMIRPNMATMLGYVATDASIKQRVLDELLQDLVGQSFNRITVDGDTSTNDCCVLMATHQVNTEDAIDSTEHPHYQPLKAALTTVFKRLAELIVRDGEGATKFVTITVAGGATTSECCNVAYSVAHSPLVKTALFASDPNWGRILAAIGNAGVTNLDTDCIDLDIGDINLLTQGQINPNYTEAAGQAAMATDEIVITIYLNRGDATDTVYTCDLSYDYVKINADYRS